MILPALLSIIVFTIIQGAGPAFRDNLIAVGELHTVEARKANKFYELASCIVRAYYSPGWNLKRNSREGFCPSLNNPILMRKKQGKKAELFQYLDGWTMLGQGRTAEALALWRGVDQSDLFTAWLGVSAYKGGNTDLALAFFQLSQEIDPRVEERKQPMYSAQCRIYLDKRQVANAIMVCERAAKFEEESKIRLGRAYVENGQYTQAVAVLSEFLLKHPDRSSAHYWRAKAYRKLGDLRSAEQDYWAAIAGDELVSAAYAELAQVLTSLDKPCEARELLLDAARSSNEELRKRVQNGLRGLDQTRCED